MKFDMQKWYLEELPCYKEHALGEHESPPCLFHTQDTPLVREIGCPAYARMHDSIEEIKSEAYKGGYGFVAFVVREGPRCELVAFAKDPDENDLRKQYGDKLIAIVPV